MTTGFVFLQSTDGTSAIHATAQDLADTIAQGLDCEAPECTSVYDLENFLKAHGESARVFESFESLTDSDVSEMLGLARAVGDPFGVSVLEAEASQRSQRTTRAGTGLPGQAIPT